jgi:hypothetical protein
MNKRKEIFPNTVYQTEIGLCQEKKKDLESSVNIFDSKELNTFSLFLLKNKGLSFIFPDWQENLSSISDFLSGGNHHLQCV